MPDATYLHTYTLTALRSHQDYQNIFVVLNILSSKIVARNIVPIV